MLTWPHANTDWAPILREVEVTFTEIAQTIARHQMLLIAGPDKASVLSRFTARERENIRFYELPTNDTWARDHGPISIVANGMPVCLDFGFNGWGNKFEASLDNLITEALFRKGAFLREVRREDHRDFILEGGSIESDGAGTILTTSACLLNHNRNGAIMKEEAEARLKATLGADRILWVDHGHLEGDDTDSHIDTLARFCDEETIAYVKCNDSADPHFEELKAMEEELASLRMANGKPYRLVPLPMADAIYEDESRLPATYANFLIMNDVVLVPVYQQDKDKEALEALREVFPGRDIIPINCLPLIRQNGSLHCITMQIPKGFLI